MSREGALLTRFAKQMEAAGLISRLVDPHDNRFTLVSLTKAGQQTLEESSPLPLISSGRTASALPLGLRPANQDAKRME